MLSAQMTEVYSRVQQPIAFYVSDLLRASCRFSKVEDINECVDKLKEKINESKEFKLIDLDNRLGGHNRASDIVLHLLIGKTVAEVQLSIDFNSSDAEFADHIEQMISPKTFSPLTTLKTMNEDLKNEFLKEVSQCFAVINAHSAE